MISTSGRSRERRLKQLTSDLSMEWDGESSRYMLEITME